MSNLNVRVRRSRSTSIGVSTPSPGEEWELEEDQRDAERELQQYEQAGLLMDASERTTDLVRFWEQKEHIYPLLFHVAKDVLLAQASPSMPSVPSEHAFSSSKLTCTERRNKLSPAIVEALQILKSSFKQDRLDFTPDLVGIMPYQVQLLPEQLRN